MKGRPTDRSYGRRVIGVQCLAVIVLGVSCVLAAAAASAAMWIGLATGGALGVLLALHDARRRARPEFGIEIPRAQEPISLGRDPAYQPTKKTIAAFIILTLLALAPTGSLFVLGLMCGGITVVLAWVFPAWLRWTEGRVWYVAERDPPFGPDA